MEKEKSKFGKFLQKVGNVFPDVMEVGLTAMSNPLGAIKLVTEKLQDKVNEDSGNAAEASLLLLELKREENTFLADMYKEDTKRIESVHGLEAVQLQQEDLFTKRARPTRQYFWLLFLLICFPIAYLATGATMELPSEVIYGIFADFGFYTYKRTEEKLKLNNSTT